MKHTTEKTALVIRVKYANGRYAKQETARGIWHEVAIRKNGEQYLSKKSELLYKGNLKYEAMSRDEIPNMAVSYMAYKAPTYVYTALNQVYKNTGHERIWQLMCETLQVMKNGNRTRADVSTNIDKKYILHRSQKKRIQTYTMKRNGNRRYRIELLKPVEKLENTEYWKEYVEALDAHKLVDVEASDLIQEATEHMILLYRLGVINSFADVNLFRHSVYRAVQRYIHRQKREWTEIDIADVKNKTAENEALARIESSTVIEAILKHLKDAARSNVNLNTLESIYKLVLIQGYSQAYTAEKLGISQQRVSKTVAYVREKLTSPEIIDIIHEMLIV